MSIPHETVIQSIQAGGEETAKLALLVADAVPRRKKEIEDKAFQGVWDKLSGLQLDSRWCLEKRDGSDRRLFLHRRGWDRNANHGVWLKWGSWWTEEKTPGIWVGVEWPLSATNLSRDKLMHSFPENARERGPEWNKPDGKNKEWFALPIGAPEWLRWNTLLAKRNDEIKTYADEAAGVMQELTKRIDELDPPATD